MSVLRPNSQDSIFSSSKRALGEETFQREIMMGNTWKRSSLEHITSFEKSIKNPRIVLNCGDQGSSMHGNPRTCCGTLRGLSQTSSSRSWTAAPLGDPVSAKTSGRRSRTNCCPAWGRSQGARTIDGVVLKRFISSLRVAETVWMEGVFLKDYPPEAYTIKCLEVDIL